MIEDIAELLASLTGSVSSGTGIAYTLPWAREVHHRWARVMTQQHSVAMLEFIRCLAAVGEAHLATPATSAAELIVEIHAPSTPTPGLGKDEYQYPWIFDIEDYLVELDGSQGEAYDAGESWGEEYLFFLSSGSESQLIAIATIVANCLGCQKGFTSR